MAQQTINVGAAPNDGTGTPLRTAFQYTNSNFTELYTAVGPSGNNIVVPGTATITGDLTVNTNVLKVDTTNDRVGIGTASPAATVSALIGSEFLHFGFGANNDNYYTVGASGTHFWRNSSTTQMTLNSTGLGVGVSPAFKLDIAGSIQTNADVRIKKTGSDTFASGPFVYLNSGDGSGNGSALQLNATNGLDIWNSTGGVWSRRMIVDIAGNVGIGVTPSAWSSGYTALQNRQTSWFSTSARDLNLGANVYVDAVGYKYIATASASSYVQYQGAHSWYTAPSGTAGNAITFTQAMTLDSSGNLLVGTTNTSASAGVGFKANYSATVPAFSVVVNDAAGTGAAYTLYNTNAAAYRFYVSNGGTIFATNTTISAISDARLKENVQDLDVGLGAILALKPRKFDWKEGKGKNIKGDRGFIAQEFETVFPNLIDEWKDEAPEGEAPYKSVRQDLIPVLVKAIQELTARVQTLEAR